MARARMITVTVSSLATVLGGCTQSASEVHTLKEPASLDCEQMNRNLLEEYQPSSIVHDVVALTSKSVAYGATAAGYLLDYTVIAGLGVVTLGVMCPGLVFRTSGNVVCLPLELGLKVNKTVPNINLGPRLYDSTDSMRADAKSTTISRSDRQVARCFASRGNQDNLIKAYMKMKWLADSPIDQQVSTAERHEIDAQTSDTKMTLLDRYPSFEQEMTRKNRQLVVDLLKNAAATTDWLSPKDGSRCRLVKVGVPTADIAKVACSNLGEMTDGGTTVVWRIPQKTSWRRPLPLDF